MWVELQYCLQQPTSLDEFIDCEEEQEFWGAESDECPRHLGDKPTDSRVTSGGYLQVRVVPCAYDQGAEAKRNDSESPPLLWFWHPYLWGVAGSGGIGRKVLHLFCGSVKTIDPAN